MWLLLSQIWFECWLRVIDSDFDVDCHWRPLSLPDSDHLWLNLALNLLHSDRSDWTCLRSTLTYLWTNRLWVALHDRIEYNLYSIICERDFHWLSWTLTNSGLTHLHPIWSWIQLLLWLWLTQIFDSFWLSLIHVWLTLIHDLLTLAGWFWLRLRLSLTCTKSAWLWPSLAEPVFD